MSLISAVFPLNFIFDFYDPDFLGADICCIVPDRGIIAHGTACRVVDIKDIAFIIFEFRVPPDCWIVT
ncbi:hypothetical protein ACFLZT_02615 [Thermodesulfobacteriota bacterium]